MRGVTDVNLSDTASTSTSKNIFFTKALNKLLFITVIQTNYRPQLVAFWMVSCQPNYHNTIHRPRLLSLEFKKHGYMETAESLLQKCNVLEQKTLLMFGSCLTSGNADDLSKHVLCMNVGWTKGLRLLHLLPKCSSAPCPRVPAW